MTERHDDNEKAFANQLDAFDENFESVTKFYENYLLRIDSNRTADVVWDELNYRLHKIFKYEIIFFCDNSTLTASTLADNYAYTYLHMDTLLAQQGPIISVNTSVDIMETAAVIADVTKDTAEKSKPTDIIDVNANKEETREGGSNEDSVDMGEDTGNKGQDEEKKKLPATEYGSKITSEVMVSVLEEAMKKSNFTKFIIEGFPRNEENLKYYLASLGKRSTINFGLFYDGVLQPKNRRQIVFRECHTRFAWIRHDGEATNRLYGLWQWNFVPTLRRTHQRSEFDRSLLADIGYLET